MKKEWERLEPIRTRIMSEAYNLADRGDSEGYNSVKVMCSDVLALIETEIATERNALDLQTTIERGTKAWADVPDATEWVEELRGNVNEWVGLTHDEVNSWELPDSPTVFEFAQFVEAKLKEKNT
jgi:hypothetical protein